MDVKKLCETDLPVIVDRRNVIDPNEFITNDFVYKGIDRGDKHQHLIVGH